MVKKRGRRVSRRTRSKKEDVQRFVFTTKRKINLALRNLLLFLVLALVSYVLYKVVKNTLFYNLFSLLTIIFAFVALAFFIVVLVFLVLKMTKKPEEPVKHRRRARRRRR